MEHMLKSKRLADYKFPYAILVSKLIDHFGVDTTNERNKTIKAVSEIENSTLIKMGFHKVEDNWVFHKSRRNMKDQISTMKREMMQCIRKMIQCKQQNNLAMKFLTHHTEWNPLLNLL